MGCFTSCLVKQASAGHELPNAHHKNYCASLHILWLWSAGRAANMDLAGA